MVRPVLAFAMGKVFDHINDATAEFIAAQPMFFIATAPLSADGHVNLSPKGHDTLRIVSTTQVAYLDLGGSGIETTAHLRENGRVTLMFCAFSGSPKIVRLYGRGQTIEPGHPEFEARHALFPTYTLPRAVIVIDVHTVAHSCGYGVPKMKLMKERDQLGRWAEKKGPEAVREYRLKNNLKSLDGLPGLTELE